MSKLRNLKLKDVEVLNGFDLKPMAIYTNDGSGSGSGDGSGSGSGDSGGRFCPDDQCRNHSDCGEDRYCASESCAFIWSYKKCKDMSSQQLACAKKTSGSHCSYITIKSVGGGNTVDVTTEGKCQQYTGMPLLSCLTLNEQPGGVRGSGSGASSSSGSRR
ncbi:MAG: hypothetical protein E6767_05135 [Dysgonomonas sp.]|nr:hypothetical protein [Dysgonomonas sp.]